MELFLKDARSYASYDFVARPDDSIGRDDSADITVADPTMSRTHATFLFLNDQWIVQDLDSKEGIRVNGRRISRSTVCEGDRVQLGRTVLTVISPPANRKTVERLLDDVRSNLENQGIDWSATDPDEAHSALNDAANAIDGISDEKVSQVMAAATGLGPLENLLDDSEITEIMVNGADTIFVERRGKICQSDVVFESEAQLRRVIDRIASLCARKVDERAPLLDARLADGSRVHAVLPPIALNGSVLTIRKFNDHALDAATLIAGGSISSDGIDILRDLVTSGANLIISGGTGTGKTTLLNILSTWIPENQRIITIEDSAELRLRQAHVVRLETRPARPEGGPEIPIRELVRNSLRMRPDRLVVGECRGGEAIDMVQAMNTGHDGSMTTVHSNSPRDAIARLEIMCLYSGLDVPIMAIRSQVVSAIDAIVQVKRLPNGRRVISHIDAVERLEGEIPVLKNLYKHAIQTATKMDVRV